MIGGEGHGDSLTLDFAFSDEVLFAVGMNRKTTFSRTHGFPARLPAPRYNRLKSGKRTGEVALVKRAAGMEIDARAMDGTGRRQEAHMGPMFPPSVAGPTLRRVS